MKRISKLTINNFKAFKQSETISFDAKNILIHGTNGSGKSSLYWTLYTFLQSSFKKDLEQVKKYFRLNDPESLRNIHADDTADSFIELELINTDNNIKRVYKISETLVNTQEPNDSNIKDANQASDFINYRLLLNFYNSAHSEEIELFWVFKRDILPYFNNTNGDNFSVLYKELSENTAEKRQEAEKVLRGIQKLSGLTISSVNKQYNNELTNFNTDLETFVVGLIQPSNAFLNTHFLGGDRSLRISLAMTGGASYDKKKKQFYAPSIKMTIEQLMADGTYKMINRPHSFLNEARLTQIALSVRLAAMLYRVQTTNLFKFLVLDDMLISLDMSNRMNVVKIILTDPAFADFQLIILTHDKSFFNLIKRNTISQDWKYFDFVKDDDPASQPKVKDSKTELEKAKEYFEDKDFEGCANYLRKTAESLLTHFLDPEMKNIDKGFVTLSNKINEAINKVGDDGYLKFKQTFIRPSLTIDQLKELENDFENNPALGPDEKGKLRGLKKQLFRFTIEQNAQHASSRNVINELNEIKDRILNPLSHGNAVPHYEQELKDAIRIVEDLKVFLDSKAHPVN
ncbi:MAG TPA: AAA family ATPase [Ferruginibacter sp.]|jgi:ABC-type lipoprotein export system ATPase subunit|nr:AAA family ATPase [Ferruginibacter sp.]